MVTFDITNYSYSDIVIDTEVFVNWFNKNKDKYERINLLLLLIKELKEICINFNKKKVDLLLCRINNNIFFINNILNESDNSINNIKSYIHLFNKYKIDLLYISSVIFNDDKKQKMNSIIVLKN